MLGCGSGGSANVFCRALGMPFDPVEATGELVSALRDGRTRTIGLARATGVTGDGDAFDRWITFNAGLGLDAEIIHSMEAQRAAGKEASPTRYLMTSVRSFFTGTNRKEPAVTLHVPPPESADDPPDGESADGEIPGVYLAIVQNASPWTYLGTLAVNPLPGVDWDNGLGVWAVRRMRFVDGIRYTRRVLMRSKAGSTKTLFVGTDLPSFRAEASPPIAMQIDGEGLGEIRTVDFTITRTCCGSTAEESRSRSAQGRAATRERRRRNVSRSASLMPPQTPKS